MKAVEKRDLLVKEVLKPMLKEAGFKTKRTEWWKELEDGYLFIHMKNSHFNGEVTGCGFRFQISASYRDDVRDKLEKQWINNQRKCIKEDAFLPYLGQLSPNRDSLGYRIDGYRNYKPADVPAEEILTQIRDDFESYIMPQIMQIKCVDDFDKIRTELRKKYDTKEDKLLRYYSAMHTMSCSDDNLPFAVQMQKQFELTAEDIRAHYDWLAIIAKNSEFPDVDARPYIEKALTL